MGLQLELPPMNAQPDSICKDLSYPSFGVLPQPSPQAMSKEHFGAPGHTDKASLTGAMFRQKWAKSTACTSQSQLTVEGCQGQAQDAPARSEPRVMAHPAQSRLRPAQLGKCAKPLQLLHCPSGSGVHNSANGKSTKVLCTTTVV